MISLKTVFMSVKSEETAPAATPGLATPVAGQQLRVLLTGATGYLGSRLATRLVADGFHVVVVKRSFSDLRRISAIVARDQMFDVDLEPLTKAFTRFGRIDSVVHCATDYGRKQSSVPEIVEANLMLPLRLLQLAEEFGARTFVNSDTFLDKRVNEYSLSKKQFLDWLKLHSSRLVCRSLRLEHFYGPGDDPTKFVGWLLSQFAAEVPEIRLTPGEQKRDFVFIDDVVEAFVRVIQDSRNQNPGFVEFDVGSGQSVTIRTLVQELQAFFPDTPSTPIFGALPYRRAEIMDSRPDISAMLALGWRPRVSLREGLAMTVHAAFTQLTELSSGAFPK